MDKDKIEALESELSSLRSDEPRAKGCQLDDTRRMLSVIVSILNSHQEQLLKLMEERDVIEVVLHGEKTDREHRPGIVQHVIDFRRGQTVNRFILVSVLIAVLGRLAWDILHK